MAAGPAPFPGFVPPMLASIADAPFSSPEWVFEPKLDGYRTIALVKGGKATLWSRRGMDVTEKYSVLVPSLLRQPVSEVVLDGEIVAMDDRGRICFECLQQYLQTIGAAGGGRQFPLIYYVFDIIHLDGKDLRSMGLGSRKELLKSVLVVSEQVRPVESFAGDGHLVYEAAVKSGLEGVVAKRIGEPIRTGQAFPGLAQSEGGAHRRLYDRRVYCRARRPGRLTRLVAARQSR